MVDGVALSRSTAQALGGLLGADRRGIKNTVGRPPVPGTYPQTPDKVIVLTPSGGIPGMVSAVGTAGGDEPGYADCRVYRILRSGGVPKIQLATTQLLTVFNLSINPVAGSAFTTAARDKFGTWIVDETGESIVVEDTGTADHPFTPSADCGVGCGWFSGMLTTWCLTLGVLSAHGEFACLDTSQVLHLRWISGKTWRSQKWYCAASGSGSGWVDDYFVIPPIIGTGPGFSGVVEVTDSDDDGVSMTIGGIAMRRDCCSDGSAQFSGGTLLGFPPCHDPPTDICVENVFRVKVACSCCSIEGWEGEGWYCVETTGTGTGSSCEPLFLTDLDRCDPTIRLCSCKYDSFADASAACGTVTVGCRTNPLSRTLTAAITNKTGDCTCIPDSIDMIYEVVDPGPPEQGVWQSDTVPGYPCTLGNCSLNLTCAGGVLWTLGPADCVGIATPVLISDTLLIFDVSNAFGGPYSNCTGTYRVTIPLTP